MGFTTSLSRVSAFAPGRTTAFDLVDPHLIEAAARLVGADALEEAV